MNSSRQNYSVDTLLPQKVREKADILENHLFKSISKQTDPSKITIKIIRSHFSNLVINRALIQLMPKFNIKPREFVLGIRDLLEKKIPEGHTENFETNLDLKSIDGMSFDDSNIISRNFKAVVSKKELEITVKGVPAVDSINGKISKTYFDYKLSPGKLLKDGTINFKEINKYPIINSGKKLFYITHEKQGKQGLSFDGEIIPVKKAEPFKIQIGEGVEKIEDKDEAGHSKGYFLYSKNTGVIILKRNESGVVNSIGISEKIELKKLDYSTGNIGTRFTCPIQMKVGEICNDFKIRVHGKVEAVLVDGGQIITNNEAVITSAQSGSEILALKDITIGSATLSKLISEKGNITINKGLIDSQISSPKVVFNKNRGLLANSKIETESILLSGLMYSGRNRIYFGSNLFVEQEELLISSEGLKEEEAKLLKTRDEIKQKMPVELKRMATVTLAGQDILKHVKPIIIATETMDYKIIYREMDAIQKKNNTKTIANMRKLFETFEKISKRLKTFPYRVSTLQESLYSIHQRMSSMELSIDGILKRAATLEIFCGLPSDGEKSRPSFVVESDDNENKKFKVTATYSAQNGFEFVQ